MCSALLRLVQHSNLALHNLFVVFNQLDLSCSVKCKLFDSLVGSVLHYGAEVWGNYKGKSIELIHRKFIRKILGVKKSTNIDELYGEIGRYPMQIQRKFIMIKYWIKVISSNHTLTKYVYNMMKVDVDNNKHYNGMNWAFNIKCILDEIGMTDIWLNQSTSPIYFNVIKERIADIFKQNWYSGLCNSNRLSFYNLYKNSFCLEPYLELIDVNKFRVALTKFKLSSHDLAIEKGRYTNIAREERLCQHCTLNVVENEYHFLLVCPKYRSLRIKYLKPYYCHWPNLKKFENLMSAKQKNQLFNLSKYLYYAFKLRSE